MSSDSGGDRPPRPGPPKGFMFGNIEERTHRLEADYIDEVREGVCFPLPCPAPIDALVRALSLSHAHTPLPLSPPSLQDAKANLGTVEAQMRDTVAATLDAAGGANAAPGAADPLPPGRVAPGPAAVDYSAERDMVDDPGAGAAAVSTAWR